FSPMWAGQAAALGRAVPAGQLTKMLAAEGARADAGTRRIEGALAARDAQARTPRICRCETGRGDRELRSRLCKPRLCRVECRGIGCLERDPRQAGAVFVALSRARAVPDIGGDVMMITAR